MAKKTRRGQKQCPVCRTWVKGTRAKNCPKCGYDFTGKQPALAAEATPAPAEKSVSAVTVEQVKAVTQTIKALGGVDRLNELLG